jgi:hypothetical protein
VQIFLEGFNSLRQYITEIQVFIGIVEGAVKLKTMLAGLD